MHTLRYYIDLIKESELVEPKITTKTVQKLNVGKLNSYRLKRRDKDSSGFFAYASQIDPHQVKLTQYLPSNKNYDPKFIYIQSIKHLMGGNPFVPTVYEIKVVKSQDTPNDHVQKPTYIMQNLLSYKDVPVLGLYAACAPVIKSFLTKSQWASALEKELESAYINLKKLQHTVSQKITSNEIEDPIGSEVSLENTNDAITLKTKIISITVNCLEELFVEYLPSSNDALNQVMDIIKDLVYEHDFRYDLHINNVMFRSTSVGYQLVITDPLAK